jgi:hypothetical protein
VAGSGRAPLPKKLRTAAAAEALDAREREIVAAHNEELLRRHIELRTLRRPVRPRTDVTWLAPRVVASLAVCNGALPGAASGQQRAPSSLSLETAELVRCLELLHNYPRRAQS